MAQVGMMYKLPPGRRRRDERGQPDHFVATVVKSKRKGKILLTICPMGTANSCRAVSDVRRLAPPFPYGMR